jgi:RimJ/RimL family protein N-acetyltransferase
VPGLDTARLRLRRWCRDDLEPFAAMNADPDVMRYFPFPLTRDESDDMVTRIDRHFERHGFGLWALERRHSGQFIGFAGLSVPRFTAHFTPCVEVGWRLARPFWDCGYATEAAQAAVAHGFTDLRLSEVVSFTTLANERSQRVMHRLGMRHDPADDFEHPVLAASNYAHLAPHVLFRLRPGHSRIEHAHA